MTRMIKKKYVSGDSTRDERHWDKYWVDSVGQEALSLVGVTRVYSATELQAGTFTKYSATEPQGVFESIGEYFGLGQPSMCPP